MQLFCSPRGSDATLYTAVCGKENVLDDELNSAVNQLRGGAGVLSRSIQANLFLQDLAEPGTEAPFASWGPHASNVRRRRS